MSSYRRHVTANTRFLRKSPEGVTIRIQVEFQNHVSKVLQVPCQQEDFNHDHIWAMRQNNKDQNFSWNELRSGLPSRKTHQIPQPIGHHLFWKQRRRLIIQALSVSHSSEVDEQLQ